MKNWFYFFIFYHRHLEMKQENDKHRLSRRINRVSRNKLFSCCHKTFTVYNLQIWLITTTSPLWILRMCFAYCWMPPLPSPMKIPGRHFNPNIILQINEIQQQLFHLWTIPNQVLMTEDHSSSCAWVGSSEKWVLGPVQFVVESAHATKLCCSICFLADSICGKGRTSRLRPWTEKPF